MRKALEPGEEGEGVAYVMGAMEAYVECAAFARKVGGERWLGGGEEGRAFGERLADDHIGPTMRMYVTGLVPLMAKKREGVTWKGEGRRVGGGGGGRDREMELARAVAKAVEGFDAEKLVLLYKDVAEAFVERLYERNAGEVRRRYELVLGCLSAEGLPSTLAASMVRAVIKVPVGEAWEEYLATISVTLASKCACEAVAMRAPEPGLSDPRLVSELRAYAKGMLQVMSNGDSGVGGRGAWESIGDLYSWMCWITEAREGSQILDTAILDDVLAVTNKKEALGVVGEIVRAHERRRKLEHIRNWKPLAGMKLEQLVEESGDLLNTDVDLGHVVLLLSAACDSQGGAALPMSLLRLVAESLSEKLVSGNDGPECDDLTATLLRSSILYVEGEEHFQKLLAASVVRMASSEGVQSTIISHLESLSGDDIVDRVSRMLSVLRARHEQHKNDASSTQHLDSAVIVRLLALVGNKSPHGSVTLCESLLLWSPVPTTQHLLAELPLRLLFGDGVDVAVHYNRLLDIIPIVRSNGKEPDGTSSLQHFMGSLSADEMEEIVHVAGLRFLNGTDESLPELLRICSTDVRIEMLKSSAPFGKLGRDIESVIPSTTEHGDFDMFIRVPKIVHMCIDISNGSCLESLQNAFAEIVKVIRRDPLSSKAYVAIDVLAVTVMACSQTNECSDRPFVDAQAQLAEHVAVCLLAIRRALERASGASVEEVHRLETHAAFLLAQAITGSVMQDVPGDDIRFWALRSRDILESYIDESLEGHSRSDLKCRRLSSAALLGSVLVEYHDKTPVFRAELVDEICHFGAWTAVKLLPITEASDAAFSLKTCSSQATGDGSSRLLLQAAERSVLLDRDGTIPAPVEKVYSLAPLLANPSVTTRMALLALLTHACAIDLPETVSKAFPNDGFKDEAAEKEFMTSMIPEPLRLALEWHAEGGDRDSDPCFKSVTSNELGYFLAWRLFLDVIRADETVSESALLGDVQEDVSFRRVGISFLRANRDLYAEFFNRCVEVVIDGSTAERLAAGPAAAEALESEERAAQGAQLVEEQRKEDKHQHKAEDESGTSNESPNADVDAEVGRAAGIVFARALQRLPALSRQHVTDRLDRGTAQRVEAFVRKKISPLLIAAEIRKVRDWGAFGGNRSASRGASSSNSTAADAEGEGELQARGSVAGGEVWATYTFSDVTLEIGMRLPEVFPLHTVEVEARSRIGMSEARWRRTLLGMTTLLRAKDGSLAEAVELWRRNLDKTFQGSEECPICYSVLHLTSAALPRMQCRACKNQFHSECLCKWFTKSNGNACPLCRSAF